ncbi:gastrula zinc finger protein XlCGF49.1-like, partial [Ornithodoros turicata]
AVVPGDTKDTSSASFKCPLCGGVFVTAEYLKEHRRTKHLHKGGTHLCRFCDYTSDVPTYVEVHERCHTGERPYVCKICSKGFIREANMDIHVKTVHGRERTYECSPCGRTFKLRHQLRKHEKVHSNDRPYVCELCGKGFKVKHNLRTHHRTHTGERPYPCTDCGSSFADQSTLRQHVLYVHTRNFPHKCVCCARGFAKRSELERHLLRNPDHGRVQTVFLCVAKP